MVLGVLAQSLDDLDFDDKVGQILRLAMDSIPLRRAWAFSADLIAQRMPKIAYGWEENLRVWIKNDSCDQEHLIKLYRHMFSEFHLVNLFGFFKTMIRFRMEYLIWLRI